MKKENTLPRTNENVGYNQMDLMYTQIAKRQLESGSPEGAILAKKTLERVLTMTNQNSPWLINSINDEETGYGTTKTAIKNHIAQYKNYEAEQKVSDLIKYCGKTLDSYFKGINETIIEKLGKISEMKYGDIEKEISKAKYVLAGKDKGRSEAELEKANKTIEKYEKVTTVLSGAYQKMLSEFDGEANDEMFGKYLEKNFLEPEKPAEKSE